MPQAHAARPANMTFSIPDRLRKRAQARKDVNWSAVVAQAIEERLNGLEVLDRITAKAHLSERDVAELADAVDDAMARHFGAA